MKKLFLFLSAIPLLFFFACDDFSGLEIPEKISVKTGARFALPLGNGDIKIREKASIEEIQRVLDDNIKKNTSSESETQNKPEVYEYNPPIDGKISESAVMQYIINYPIKEIPLSIGDKNIENTNLEKIEIPETKFTAPDFNESISDTLTIKGGKPFPMVEPAELGPRSISDLGFTFDITTPNFTEMIVRSGKMKIVIKKTDSTPISEGFSMQARIVLVNANDHSKIIAASDNEECAPGNTIRLDLAGKPIVQNMYIIVEGSLSGGTLGVTHTYEIEMGPENLQIDKITGLTMSHSDLGENGRIYIPKEFELAGLNQSLQEATIEKGELDFYCKLPEGWSGIKVEKSNFTITGGVNISNDKFSPDTDTPEGYALYKKATLDDLRVVPEKTYTYDTSSVTPGDTSNYTETNISWLEVALENATIIFADTSAGEKTELVMSGICSITKLKNIKIKLEDLANFSGNEDTGLNFSTLLSDIMKGDGKDLIKDIKFADSTLDDGSKVEGYLFVSKPDIKSEALQDLEIVGKIHASYTDEKGTAYQDLYFLGDEGEEPEKNGSMEMRIPIISFAQAAAKNLGKLITDPDVIRRNDEGRGYSHKIPDGKISKLLNDRPDNLKISYDLHLDPKKSKGVINLDGDAIEELKKTDAKISVSLALVLPLQIQLEDNYDIPTTDSSPDGWIKIKDVISLTKDADERADLNKDLFDRSEAKDTDFYKYAEGLKASYIAYHINNNLILNEKEYEDPSGTTHKADEDLNVKLYLYTVETDGTTIKPVFDPNEEETDPYKKYRKELKISDGMQSLNLSKNEISKILSKEGYPFIPKICAEIEVPTDGTNSQVQYIPRNGGFDISGTVHLEFDENIPVEVWSK
ncbi:hypothetical protein [uncultured Treponema sp.]|uniref:hypothetical protein n=1 Tax=uncultured Treponema sp. TaxID=162155 RepID=UPI0025D688FC|nr:hypothetical protein [uncultured Treponema sp.]